MVIPFQPIRVSTLVLIVGIVGSGFAVPATKAEPPTPTKVKPPPRKDRYGDPLPPGALARLGTVRLRPAMTLALLACLPDGTTVLSVGSDDDRAPVYLWDISTGRLLRSFEPPSRIRVPGRAALSPDGKILAISGLPIEERPYRVALLEVPSGKLLKELKGIDAGVLTLAFAPDGKTLAMAGRNLPIRLWDWASAKELRRCGQDGVECTHLAFSPDGKVLASAGGKGKVQLWDAATGRELRSLGGHTGRTAAAVFSPDGKLLATAGQDAAIRLWDPATGKEVRQLRGERGTSALAFSPDGKRLASGDAQQKVEDLGAGSVRLWDVSTGREEWRSAGHLSGVDGLAFTPDGKKLISGCGSNVLHVWDAATGKDLLPFAEPQSWIWSVAFSPDGKTVAACGFDGAIWLWEPASGRPSRILDKGHRQWLWYVAFCPDGRSLVSYGRDGTARFWDIAAGRELRRFQVPDQGMAARIDLSSDGQTMAVVAKDAIRLLDAANGKERKRFERIGRYNSTIIRVSPDGKRLASLELDGSREKRAVLRMWDTATGKELRKWTTARVARFAFSPDGRTLAGIQFDFLGNGTSERTVHIWDIDTGDERSFKAIQLARVFSLVYSPDGRTLAWGDTHGIVTLCELSTGQVRHRFRGHRSFVNSLAFAPDGERLASGSADTTVLIWDAIDRTSATHTGRLSSEQLQALWADLAGKDAAKAFDAIGLLTASPQQAVPLLKGKLRPAPEAAERKQVARLIADLDSDTFDVREKAKEQLRRLGERAEPGLREALKNKLPLETRKRIDELMEGLKALSVTPDRLRELRAVEVLEHIGTTETRQMLRTLADGAAHARLTREAKVSLKRLDKRRSPMP